MIIRTLFHSRRFLLALALVPLLCAALHPVPSAWAHRVNLFAWAEGDSILGETSYPSGKPVMGGTVTVTAGASEDVLVEIITDDNGLFSFAIPEQARTQGLDLLLTLDAGVGHQTTWTVTAAEFADIVPQAAQPSSPAGEEAVGPADTAAAPQADIEAIASLMEQKLGPIRKQLAEIQANRTSVTDVVGGIGYLVGLFGLLAWFKSRQPSPSSTSSEQA